MELWTEQHMKTLLPSLAVMILLGLFLRQILGNKSFKIKIIPIQIIAILLVSLEIGKQFTSFQRGYDLYHIPLHFCSLFIFMLPAMAFYRGKYAQAISIITTALCASVFCLMLIYPNLIYSAGNIEYFFVDFLDFHTVAFHNLVMLAFVLILALDLQTPAQSGGNKAITIFMLGFCAVSSTMAQILKTNYANFYTCNIPVLEEVRISVRAILGTVVTQIIYILILTVLNIGFVLGCNLLLKALPRAIRSNSRKKQDMRL